MDNDSTVDIGITAKRRLAVVHTASLLLAHSSFVQNNATLLEEARATGIVLDSGSSQHLQRRMHVLDDGDCVPPTTGFDGSKQWTQGNGHLPVAFTDDYTGSVNNTATCSG